MAKFNRSNDDGLKQAMICLNRNAKIGSGGPRFYVSGLGVVGDGNGKVALGYGKSKEVSDATKKALERATRAMKHVPMKSKRTVHYPLVGICGASKVLVFPANVGSGIKASKPCRAVFEAAGFKDIVAKSIGSRNPLNVAKAAIDALLSAQSPGFVRKKRGLYVSAKDVSLKDSDAKDVSDKE
jgi:small subunit ribosomal protein S5